jgi:hypothetical protein
VSDHHCLRGVKAQGENGPQRIKSGSEMLPFN